MPETPVNFASDFRRQSAEILRLATKLTPETITWLIPTAEVRARKPQNSPEDGLFYEALTLARVKGETERGISKLLPESMHITILSCFDFLSFHTKLRLWQLTGF